MGTHPIFESDFDCLTEMSKSDSESNPVVSASSKWLPSLKKPEYVGIPQNIWTDLGSKDVDALKCSLCLHRNKTLKDSILHLRHKHKDTKPYKCEECSAGFNIKNNLENHKMVHQVNFENKLLTCPICKMTFRRHIVFRRHI